LICDSKLEAENLIGGVQQLSQKAGLNLNLEKSAILTDRIDLTKASVIGGIKVVKTFKYLGVKISLSRNKLISDAKASAKQYLATIRGKIQTGKTHLLKQIHSAFFKSMLIYFFTPLYAARIFSRN
jgi:hypothetical protein